MGYGLVFAGGGVRGSYELGVWKAILNMGVPIDAVIGVSIGSINAALFVQGDFKIAAELWQNIKMNDILCTDQLKSDNLFSVQNLLGIAKELYMNQGLDVTPLQKLLENIIDEEKVRRSAIDFGLCTYSLTDRKGIELFKQDMPKGMLCEYLMASACLPGFQSKKIGDKIFIDGGVNNNMPVSMLTEKGYHNIIAVDVGGIGLIKPYSNIGVNLIHIRCDECMVGVMEFEQESIEKNIKKGYYDCYKQFGRLCGRRYYFHTMSYYHARGIYAEDMLDALEDAAEILGIDHLAAYRVDHFIEGVVKAYLKARKKYEKQIPPKQSILEVVTKRQLDSRLIVVWLAELMQKGEHDLSNNKIMTGLLGNLFHAANAIVYFMNQ